MVKDIFSQIYIPMNTVNMLLSIFVNIIVYIHTIRTKMLTTNLAFFYSFHIKHKS